MKDDGLDNDDVDKDNIKDDNNYVSSRPILFLKQLAIASLFLPPPSSPSQTIHSAPPPVSSAPPFAITQILTSKS